MDLQISVFLLFIIFTAGHSLSCYDCTSLSGSCTQTSQCFTGFTNCFSATVTVNSTTVKFKSCAPAVCPSGSINLGIGKGSSLCCNTDLCNVQDAPDPSTNAPNGKTCYYCDGQSCLNTVSCTGSEDRCFNATGENLEKKDVTIGVQSQVFKGCVSKSLCDATTLIPSVGSVSCCEGNLCNGAKSVTQSFLFLCCSLLSFILLH
ncbi:prostate stem cell antigen-like isoform X1 [Sinocyclocheilus rhinocerous]|uniref:prostate stem cell antigen-like isoform X1 n=1 Tax=Sinocyclocheilus rhinocerous TaxID=307959 RepID=UPI0007B8820A|nr:PREDICTED: prostate stem cell antigen-like isoform X1 [Sinocyclocheilus rhinocerous]